MKYQKKLLTELGFVSRGRSQHRPRDDKQLYGGDYPFIQTGDVKEAGFHILSYSQTYNEKGLAQSKLWDKDTLCITIAANIADTAILSFQACIPDSIVGFIANPEESDVRYVKYMFDILQREFQNISQGTSQDNLSVEKLLGIKFEVPKVENQRRIADILSAYDDLIENNQRQIKLLEEAAMRLYREWFVFMRFPGHESVRIVDGVPEGWEVKQINDVCLNCASGGTPSRKRREYWADGSVNWFKTQELVDSWLFDADEKISEKGLENSSAKLFPENTIVMAIYASPTLGRLGILTKESTFNQAALGLVANGDFVSYEWLYLKLFELRDKFNAIASGAGQQNINVKIVQTKEIVVPSHDVMGKFTEIIHPYFEKQKNLTEQIIYLQKARDALLPRLMTGGVGLKLEGGTV